MVRDLCSLIRIRSVARYDEKSAPMGNECQKAMDWFARTADAYGLRTETDSGYLLSVILTAEGQGEELGILGHLDVVPEGEGWTVSPFDAVERNGYVIGRGARDNKGPLIMALYALRCMKALGIKLNGSVRLMAGCDEEKEMRDVRHYLKNHRPPRFTINCDGAWTAGIGEKGMMIAELAAELQEDQLHEIKGGEAANMVPASAWATVKKPAGCGQRELPCAGADWQAEDGAEYTLIKTCGKTAHCSVPGNGINAIRRLLQVLCEEMKGKDAQTMACLLKAVRDDEGTGLNLRYADRESGQTTCVPSLIALKENEVRLHLDIRFAVTQNPDVMLKQMRLRCEKLGLKLEKTAVVLPRYDSPDTPEIRILTDTCHEFLGKRHKTYVSGGMTHSRLFPYSIPFGPLGNDKPLPKGYGGPHAANEAVCVEELIQGIKVYVAALIRLDRYFEKHSDQKKAP